MLRVPVRGHRESTVTVRCFFKHIEYYGVAECVIECSELKSTLSKLALNVRISHVSQVKFLHATFASLTSRKNRA